MSGADRSLIDAIERAAEAVREQGFTKAIQNNEIDSHLPLSREECSKFILALDQVDSHLKVMLLQHFYAFAQLEARRLSTRPILIADQVQVFFVGLGGILSREICPDGTSHTCFCRRGGTRPVSGERR
jgi:hypothetical protein